MLGRQRNWNWRNIHWNYASIESFSFGLCQKYHLLIEISAIIFFEFFSVSPQAEKFRLRLLKALYLGRRLSGDVYHLEVQRKYFSS